MHDLFSCFRHCDRIKHACRIYSTSGYQAEPLSLTRLVSVHAVRSGKEVPMLSSSEYCPLQGESEDAPLHIGGLRIHCEGDSVFEIAGNGRQKASNAFLGAGHSAYCFCNRLRLFLSAGQETSLYCATAVIIRR